MQDPEEMEEVEYLSVKKRGEFKSLSEAGLRMRAKLEVVKELGRGVFGAVWQVRHKRTGIMYAMKEVPCVHEEGRYEDAMMEALKEVKVLCKLRHSCITDIETAWLEYQEIDKRTVPCLYIVMELCTGGDLNKYVLSNRGLSPVQLHKALVQLARAVAYLHENQIIHRDIKPANVLLNVQHDMKMADLGMAKVLINIGAKTKEQCGTPGFVAPEIARGEEYNTQADVFSLGLTFLAVASYSVMQDPDGYFLGVHIELNPVGIVLAKQPSHPLESISPEFFAKNSALSKIILAMLAPDPNERWTMQEVYHALCTFTPETLLAENGSVDKIPSKFSDGELASMEELYPADNTPIVDNSESGLRLADLSAKISGPLVLILGVCFLCIDFADSATTQEDEYETEPRRVAMTLCVVATVSFVGTFLVWPTAMVLFRRYPFSIFYTVYVLNALTSVWHAYYIRYINEFDKHPIWSILFLIYFVALVIFALPWQKRLERQSELSQYILEDIFRVPTEHKTLFVPVFIVVVLQLGLFVLGTFFFIELDGLIAFAFLYAYFWFLNILRNVVHYTAARVYTLKLKNTVKDHPVLASIAKASASALGSIIWCTFFTTMSQFTSFLYLILNRVPLVKVPVEFLFILSRKYTLTTMAFKDIGYAKAVSRALELKRSREDYDSEGVVNNNIVTYMLVQGSFLTGLFCFWIGHIIAPQVSVVSFVVGYSTCRTVLEVFDAGIVSSYVAFIEAPALLSTSRLNCLLKIYNAYVGLLVQQTRPVSTRESTMRDSLRDSTPEAANSARDSGRHSGSHAAYSEGTSV